MARPPLLGLGNKGTTPWDLSCKGLPRGRFVEGLVNDISVVVCPLSSGDDEERVGSGFEPGLDFMANVVLGPETTTRLARFLAGIMAGSGDEDFVVVTAVVEVPFCCWCDVDGGLPLDVTGGGTGDRTQSCGGDGGFKPSSLVFCCSGSCFC